MELQELPIWGLFITESQSGKDKLRKLALSPQSGNTLSTNKPDQWGSFSQALKGYQRHVHNAKGLAMLVQPPYTVIDLDHTTVDSPTNAAKDFLQLVKGTYTERSVSGKGLHAVIRGNNNTGRNRNNNANLEVYSEKRFFAITGDVIDGTGVIRSIPDDEFNSVLERYLEPRVPVKPTQGAESGGQSYLTDEQVIEKACKAKGRGLFKSLFKDGWQEFYPSQSEADIALANMLAFWTNKDFSLMDSIFRKSALMREKWDERHGKETYGAMTLNNAIQHTHETYNPHPRKLSAAEEFSDWIEDDETDSGKTRKNSVEQPPDFRKLDFDDYAEGKASSVAWEELGIKLVDYLNAQPPEWVLYELVCAGKRNQRLRIRIVPDVLGEEIMSENQLVIYPELPNGTVYVPKLGVWKLFKPHELEMFVKHIALRKVKEITNWERSIGVNVADFVTNAAYDKDQSELPFENSNPNLVAFKNGTFNIATGELEKSKPENFIINAHEYELDVSGKETPVTDDWLKALFGESATFMKQYIGYLFYRSYDYAQVILILQSEGGHGKSKFLNYIRGLLGFGNSSNISLKQLTSNSEFNTSGLYQKTLNYFADIGADFIQSTEMLKALSGNDYLAMQMKGGQLFNSRNVARLLFSANNLPSAKVGDSGLRRRFRVVPVVSPKVDNEFKSKHPFNQILNEAPAFVYGAMMAFKRAKENIDGQDWGLTSGIVQATKQWQDDNDPVKQWLLDSLEDGSALWGEGYASAAGIYDAYRSWCSENGYKPKGRNGFYDDLERLSLLKLKKRISGRQAWCWSLSQLYIEKLRSD
ncbi:hypothetical protein FD04_GL001712 [Secundilactobacillus odoratitofui DSM 19909 = JCM 15043]|uniref:SF3 helicase domain-containing protein n=2 Tax=Secundilactobacillus odoratitofui TaxID=480930 RepID=A0A0R1LP95_9LACO|nr:hypothetical protein FD04_GL001712 [Secundilactobacillus odoratitofui DSM 19909 = JCM 15043]